MVGDRSARDPRWRPPDPIDSQNTRNNLRALTVLNAAHRTLTHRFQRCVIQLSRIVLSHAYRESYSLHLVKNYLVTYVLINNADCAQYPSGGPDPLPSRHDRNPRSQRAGGQGMR